MATMGACRLLLVCVFCALWCSAVMAAKDAATPKERVTNAAEKATKLTEASERVEKNLTTAEECVEKLKEIDESKGDLFEQAKDGVTCLTAVVKDAMDTAGAATLAEAPAAAESPTVEQSLETKELSALLFTAMGAADNLSKEVKLLHHSAEGLSDIVKEKNDSQKEAFKAQAKAMKTSLEKAKGLVSKALEIYKQLADKAAEIKTKLEKKPEGGSGKEGTQSQTDGKDSAKHSSQGAGGNNPDGAHGGAIATCTAAPLLLLLTAVAYAAVC